MKYLGLVAVLAGCGFASPAVAPVDANPPAIVDTGDPPMMIPSDATACFGTGLLRVCLGAMPTRELLIGGDTVPINTDTDCPEVVAQGSGGTALCVFSGTTIRITGLLIAEGVRPLVLVASDTVTVPVDATIDVSSTLSPPRRGAGAIGAPCSAASIGRTDTGGGGGGAGGSFGTAGGRGGNGDTNDNGPPDGEGLGGTPAPPIREPGALRGGCSGGAGGDFDASHRGGLGGDGGGAVALIAGRTIAIAGHVFASGAGGGGNPEEIGIKQGGGGGGPGGMIVFDAPQIQVQQTGRVVANGGGGGGGGGNERGGSPGGNGTTFFFDRRADRGDGDVGGGNGGEGTTGERASTDIDGEGGAGGGGGGAGGLGLIWTYGEFQSSAMISPAATTR